MRSDILVFLHVLFAMALLGSLLATAVLATSARRGTSAFLPGLLWPSSLLVLVGAIATVVLGEANQAKEDLDAGWLDASYGLTYLGLLVPSIALAVLGRLALRRPRLVGWMLGLALAMTAIAIVVAFLMAAKPS